MTTRRKNRLQVDRPTAAKPSVEIEAFVEGASVSPQQVRRTRKGRSSDENYHRLTFYLRNDLIQQLKRYALDQNLDLSEIGEKALLDFLEAKSCQ